MRILAFLFCVTLFVSGAASARTPACPAARYLLDAADVGLVFDDPAANGFSTGAGTVTLAPCGSTKAKIKGTPKGTKVTATWKTCGTRKKVVLKATVDPACARAQGTIKAKKVKPDGFGASVSTGCGDDLVDPSFGETCETAADCDQGQVCVACGCAAQTVTTTTTGGVTTTTVPAEVCGNGAVEGAEECDDENPDPTDGCTNQCTICGNGVTTAPELCDDGNLVSGDGCDANCTPTGCGNGLITDGETCDDGNTDDNDDCPADCNEAPCTPDTATTLQATITWNAASSVAGLTVLLDYPEDKVDLPGNGGNIAPGVLTNFPSGTSEQHNDLGNQGHALREVVTKATAITPRPGTLFKVTFDRCQGIAAPTASDFICHVVQAFAPDGTTPVAATCAVSVP